MDPIDSTTNAMNEPWVSIKLTHVVYVKGDLIGKFLAISSLLPIGLVIVFVTLCFSRRDLHTISYAIGFAINEIVNFILKHIIKEKRPCHNMVGREMPGLEYGMPSSHSQFMWYFAVYLSLFLLLKLHRRSSNSNLSSIFDMLWRIAGVFGALLASTIVSYSRVYLIYHTWNQIIYGGLLGSMFAIFWFWSVQVLLTPYFPKIVSWPISEFLMIRDTTCIPNILYFEYTMIKDEARKRQRKLQSTKTQ